MAKPLAADLEVSPPARPWPVSMRPWVGWALAFGFILTRMFGPDYFDNEPVYSLGPMLVFRPGMLAEQPFIQEMVDVSTVYNLLVSPLFLVLGPFWGTLACRLLIWSFQLYALSRLGRAVGLAPWGQVVLLVLWLNVEQTLAAGEWIIGSASNKPIAYGFVFLALTALLREDWRRLPIWCGLATALHVLVGGWTTLAIGLTLVLTRAPALGWRGLLRFGALAGLIAVPGLVPALLTVPTLDPAVAAEAARVSVLFANPFHQDPHYFLSAGEAVKVTVIAGAAILLARRLLAPPCRTLMPVFLSVLTAFFAAGVVARALDLYGLLMYYPFRLADAVLPFAFWIGVALGFQRWYERRPRLLYLIAIPIAIGATNWLVDRAEPSPAYSAGPRGFALAMSRTEPRMTAYWIRTRLRAWNAHLRGERDAMRRLQDWARTETRSDVVFIVPPWLHDWPIRSERAAWINYKILAPGPSILEWKARLEALNGRPFAGTGREVMTELRETYPRMDAPRAHALAARWRADYLVALNEIPDLPLVHRDDAYRVYRLGASAREALRPRIPRPGGDHCCDSAASGFIASIGAAERPMSVPDPRARSPARRQ